jgi:PAS domain S-box-containing protein
MGEALILQDRRGIIVECNPAACALFGCERDGLRGLPFARLPWHYLREDGTPLSTDEHPTEQALRLARPVRNVLLGLRPNDSALQATRWILVNSMPLVQGANNAGVVTTFTDVTAYRLAQEAGAASEQRYRELVESMPLMLAQLDRDRRIVYANPALSATTGYQPSEIADPASWANVIHPDDLPRVHTALGESLAGRPGRAEVRYRTRDGEEKVSYLLTMPRWQGTEVVGVTSLMLDVTRQRQLERELQDAQQRELLGRLSAGIAQDFHNQLAGIQDLTERVDIALPGDHPARTNVAQIRAAAEQALRLVQQLQALGPPRQT